MANYRTPGVYVNENLLNSRAVSYPSGPTALFVGQTERGPSTPTYIKNWADYRRLFGNLSNSYDVSYSVYHFFANGGRGCYIARVLGAGTAVDDADVDQVANHDIQGIPFYPYGVLSADLTATTHSLSANANIVTVVTAAVHGP